MPRVAGLRERQHQPLYDTLVRAYGATTPNIQSRTSLFGNANIGNLAYTNLSVAGQLASDQTYVILALRCWLYFDGTNRRTSYLETVSQLYFTVIAGEKPQFQAPCWYFPAGGGIWGFDSGASVLNNGTPGQDAILKLARPVIVPVRQNFSVTAEFFKIGTLDALTNLNTDRAADDQSVIMFMLDGIRTRDVQ